MFAKLFAESGLSLDRLKSLLEVGASGSIVRRRAILSAKANTAGRSKSWRTSFASS